MRLALVQHTVGPNPADNVARGLEAVRRLVETHGLWGAVKRVGKTVAGK